MADALTAKQLAEAIRRTNKLFEYCAPNLPGYFAALARELDPEGESTDDSDEDEE